MLVCWANSLSKDDLHRNMKIFICQKLSTSTPVQYIYNSDIWILRILLTKVQVNRDVQHPSLQAHWTQQSFGRQLLELRWGIFPSYQSFFCCTVPKCTKIKQRLGKISLHFSELCPLIWWAWSKDRRGTHFKMCTSSIISYLLSPVHWKTVVRYLKDKEQDCKQEDRNKNS